MQARDQCWWIVAALRSGRLKYLTFGVVSDQFGDHVALAWVHDGTDVDAFVERVADAQARHACLKLCIKSVCDPFLDQ